MYSAIEVKLASDAREAMAGHAYDISRGGVSFELDRAIEPGTPVYLKLSLPEWLQGLADGESDTVSVHVRGTVVWTDDDGVAGPVRMAAAFTSFESVGEYALLDQTLKVRRYAPAA
jgi:hypothetical protein